MNEVERIGTCKSLSGGSTLTYHIGNDEEKRLMIRLMGNSGHGLFCKEWVCLGDIQTLLSVYREPFSSKVLYPVFKGKSANSSGFLMAALLNEGLVIEPSGKGGGFVLRRSETSQEGGNYEVTPGSVAADQGQVGEE